jgi:hypothetical protein
VDPPSTITYVVLLALGLGAGAYVILLSKVGKRHLCRSRRGRSLAHRSRILYRLIMMRGVLRSLIIVTVMTGPALAETPSNKPVAEHKANSHKAKSHKARAAHHHKSHAHAAKSKPAAKP